MSDLDTEAIPEAPSIRDSLNAAIEESVEEAPAVADDVTAPVETSATEETPAERAERERDEGGRFAKKATPAVERPAAKAVPAKQGAVVPVVAPPAPEMRAPQSWRGPAKEKWASIPEEARVEVLRREKEIATQMASVAEERKYANAMRAQFAPYEAQIRAEGSTPEKAIGNLLNTAMALRTAPPAHKADMLAEMITTYGVPLEHLVSSLERRVGGMGAQPQQQRQAAPQQVDPAVIAQTVERQLMERLAAQRESQLMARYTTETERFLEGQVMHGPDGSDFTADIREDMADIIERATRRGSTMTMEQAYTLAAKQHPEVSKVLAARERQATQAKASASTQRARAAAVSVRNSPATAPVSKSASDLRSTLEAAFEASGQ